MHNYRSPLERLSIKLYTMAKADALPLASGLVAGLLAHMFVMTNKLMNADEASSLFAKGATIDSGRWALELLRYVIPDVSLPWLWGIVSLVLITIAACVALRLFNIKHPFLRALVPALFITFPSLTGTFCFMFTSSAYAVAFLMSVLAAWVFVKLKKRSVAWILSCFLLMFSVGVYQAYVAICASFFVILMIQKLLEGEEAGKVLMFGLRCVLMLVISLVVYYAASYVAVIISKGEFLVYAIENDSSLLFRVALCYNAFVKSIFMGYFGFVDTALTFAAHIVGLGLCLVLGVREFIKLKSGKSRVLLLICLVLLPLSMNCIFLISSTEIIHTLVLYSFVCIYVLAAVLLDRVSGKKLSWLRDIVVVCLMLSVVSNVFVANKVYLKLHLQYEHAYSLYTNVLGKLTASPEYDKDKTLAIVGNYSDFHEFENLETGDLFGPSKDLVNIYTRGEFLRNYFGYSADYADWDEIRAIQKMDEFVSMPCYPDAGSIKAIDDYIVVKFS